MICCMCYFIDKIVKEEIVIGCVNRLLIVDRYSGIGYMVVYMVIWNVIWLVIGIW